MTVTYNFNDKPDVMYQIYTATQGGNVFSPNLAGTTGIVLFDENTVIDDCVYFRPSKYSAILTGGLFDVVDTFHNGTFMFVVEYYKGEEGWVDVNHKTDYTQNLSVLGENKIRFPYQFDPGRLIINAQSGYWWRLRVTNVNNVLGQVIIDNTIKYLLCRLEITGGTETEPATFNGMYEYMINNVPDIPVYHINSYSYDFTSISIYNTGYLLSNNEVIEAGCEAPNYGGATIRYGELHSGIKDSEFKGHGGSTFITYATSNARAFELTQNSQMYGVTARGGSHFPGYVIPNGEHIDCNYELSLRTPGAGDVMRNIRVVGGLLIAGSIQGTMESVFYTCTSSLLFYVYREGWALKNFGYLMTADSANVFYIYQGSTRNTLSWRFQNPQTPLNDLGDNINPIRMYVYSDSTADAILKEDEQTGDVTNLTAVTPIDLGGEVGDKFYFGMTTIGASYGAGFAYYMSQLNEGYEYLWEYYDNGIWNSCDEEGHTYRWDSTNNFTQDGRHYFAIPNSGLDKANIGGYEYYYIRATITKKGTQAPICSSIKRSRASGINDWHLIEEYSLNIHLIDKEGLAIEGATVTVTNCNRDVLYNLITDINGSTTEIYVTAKEFNLDPSKSSRISENIYECYNIEIKKEGYQTININNISTTAPKVYTLEMLENVPPVYITEDIDVNITHNNLNADISNDIIYTNIEEETIVGEIDDECKL